MTAMSETIRKPGVFYGERESVIASLQNMNNHELMAMFRSRIDSQFGSGVGQQFENALQLLKSKGSHGSPRLESSAFALYGNKENGFLLGATFRVSGVGRSESRIQEELRGMKSVNQLAEEFRNNPGSRDKAAEFLASARAEQPGGAAIAHSVIYERGIFWDTDRLEGKGSMKNSNWKPGPL